MKKKEIWFGAGLFLISFLSLLMITQTEASDGEQVKITLDGSVYGIYSLAENQEIEIVDEAHQNMVCIEDGKVFMKEADCPDKYCIEQGAISNEKQTIVCLPHKLVVEIVKDEKAEEMVDVIAK